MSKINVVTPAGTINWAYISGEGKRDLNGNAIYTVDLVLPPEEAAPLIEKLDELWEENKPKGAKAPKSMGYKEKDGDIVFTFKTKTVYPSGDPKEIAVYNAKAQKVQLSDRIGNGSKGCVSGMASVYDAGVAARGVTLYLDAIQLLKLVKYEGGASFAQQEGDFEGTEETDGFVAVDLD